MKVVPVRPRRVANKIVLLVLTLELISISVWGTFTYLASREELLNTIGARLREAAVRTTSEIGIFFVPIYVESDVLATTLDNQAADDRRRTIYVQRLLKARPEIDALSIVEPSGLESIRISRMQGFAPTDLRDLGNSELVRDARHAGQASGPITFSRFLEPQLQLATRARHSSTPAAGRVVLAQVNLKWLWDIVQTQTVGRTGYVYVVDNKLALIAHRDPSFVLTGINLGKTSVPASLFDANGGQRLAIYRSLAGEPVAGVSRFDPLHQWWIVVEYPVKQGLAPLDRLVQRFVLAFFLAAMLTIAIVIIFSRITMRPLQALQHGLARLANGERDVRIDVPRHTELATLAESFNTMARNLDQKIGGLIASELKVRASSEALKTSEQQVRLLLESAAEAIFGIDLYGAVTFCNPATQRYLHARDDELLGQDIYDLLRPMTPDGRPLGRIESLLNLQGPEVHGGHLRDVVVHRRDGTTFHAELWIHPIHHDTAPIGAVISLLDITERYLHTSELERQANHDSLTGLANRKLLHQRLEDAVRESQQSERSFALYLIDLDRFKEINDALGHKSGDRLIRQIGPRLQSLLGSRDTLARLGGDEFAILARSVESVERAETVARWLRTAILEPFDLDGMRVQIDASIGIALCPTNSSDVSGLLRDADVAMYHAKRTGSGFAFYDKTFDAHSPQRLALMGELLQATRNDDLLLYYQPKIDMAEGHVQAFEALVRWRHATQGLIGPDDFIPLAELSELIRPLTLWVIERTLQDYARWRELGHTMMVAANVSARNLQDQELVQTVAALLRKHRVPAEHLQLEITESAILTDPVRARDTIAALNDLGVRFAIDDFGTGYSSLAYLKQLAVAELKIDQSFVIDMERDENDAAIVRSTIELAHNLGMRVTAEGVETQSLWRRLDELACDYVQGYYISRPMPAEQVVPWITRWSTLGHMRELFSN